MASQDEFFKINGAEELGRELRELSRGVQNKILRPALTKATGEVRKVAKKNAPVDLGILQKNIKNKTFTAKRGSKGVVGRIGVFSKDVISYGESRGVAIAKYGAVQEYGKKDGSVKAQEYLAKSLQQAEPQATQALIKRTQEKLDDFHAKQASKYKS